MYVAVNQLAWVKGDAENGRDRDAPMPRHVTHILAADLAALSKNCYKVSPTRGTRARHVYVHRGYLSHFDR